jgi:hypothetical protein
MATHKFLRGLEDRRGGGSGRSYRLLFVLDCKLVEAGVGGS